MQIRLGNCSYSQCAYSSTSSTTRFRLILPMLPLCMIITDNEYCCVWCNSSYDSLQYRFGGRPCRATEPGVCLFSECYRSPFVCREIMCGCQVRRKESMTWIWVPSSNFLTQDRFKSSMMMGT